MKRIAGMVWLGLAFCAALSAAAPSPGQRFAEAASAYTKGDFRAAARIYEALLKEGHGSAPLHFNLGNAYFKSGAMAPAILNYERAQLLDPGNETIAGNLGICNARLRDQIDPMPLFFAAEWWNALKQEHSSTELLLLSGTLLALFSIALFVFLGIERLLLRRMALVAGIAVAACFVASLFLYMDRVEDLEARRYAIVMARELSLRSTPDASGIESLQIHEGLKVEMREQRGGMWRVVLADGTEGWADARALERI